MDSSKEDKVSKEAYVSLVDPFLVEALQNPRHRLTILRMELDLQKFILNSDLQCFEFQQFPTSYIRLAAHRVAQHYGLQTTVHDNSLDGTGNRIVAWKTLETRYPPVCFSDVPAKQSECNKHEQKKIVMRPRPSKPLVIESKDSTCIHVPIRTVEQRKEEYDRARARIFSGPSVPDSDASSESAHANEGSNLCVEEEVMRSNSSAMQKYVPMSNTAVPSRVAILRDREKDRSDPDYDRSYDRYVPTLSNGWGGVPGPCDGKNPQFPFLLFDTAFSQLAQLPMCRSSSSNHSSSKTVNPFPSITSVHASVDRIYPQWPSPAIYTHSDEHARNAIFSASCPQQQALSFRYSQIN